MVHSGFCYIRIEISLPVRFVITNIRPLLRNKEGIQINPPHAISNGCYGEWRYGRHRIREKRIGEIPDLRNIEKS